MFVKQGFLGALSVSMLALGAQLPARAQAEPAEPLAPTTAPNLVENPLIEEPMAAERWASESLETSQFSAPTFDFDATEVAPLHATSPATTTPEETQVAVELSADALTESTDATRAERPSTEAAELTYPTTAAPLEVAQRRRRTRNVTSGPDFIGLGADFGYADDVSFAVISKLGLSEQISLRPSLLFGDNFAALVPVTYEFNQFNTDAGNFQLRPYAGAGFAYLERDDDDDDDSNFQILLSAGIDVPIARQFTFNAQANLGFIDGTEFGGTIGVGYNLGRLFR